MTTVLALLVALGVLVVRLPGARVDDPTDRSASRGHGVRRFFQYTLLFGLLIVSAQGITTLMTLVLGDSVPDATGAAGPDTYTLARALTFTAVGVPLSALLSWSTLRRMRHDPAERTSRGFETYVTAAALTALAVTALSARTVLAAAFTLSAPDTGALCRLVVWGTAWGVHWMLATRFLPPGAGLVHRVAGSTIGVVMLAAGWVDTIATSVEILVGARQFIGGGAALATSTALGVIGVLVWLRYWFLGASRDAPTTPWRVHVLVVGVGGGWVLSLVGASMSVWTVLVWFLGHPLPPRASLFFAEVPSTAAMVPVGLALWWYYRDVLQRLGPSPRTEVRRVYEYLMSGVALVGSAWGVVVLVASLVEAFTDGTGINTGARNTVLAAVTVLAVSVPVWAVFWRSVGEAASADPGVELASRTRRVYLALVLGIGVAAGVVALVAGVLVVMEDVTAGTLSAASLRSSRVWLGVAVAAAAVVVLHMDVWREDRERTAAVPVVPSSLSTTDEGVNVDTVEVGAQPTRFAPEAPTARALVLVGADAPEDLLRRLAEAGVGTEVWTVEGAPAWDADAVLATVSTHPVGDLLLLAEADGVRVVDVERASRVR